MRLAKLVGRENVIAGDRLRLRAGAVLPARPSDASVGEAPGAGRRRAAREQGAVGQGEEGGEEEEARASRKEAAADPVPRRKRSRRPERNARPAVIRVQRLRRAAQRVCVRCRAPSSTSVFSASPITPAISSLFFSSIIMWPLPRMPMSSSRRKVTRHAGLRRDRPRCSGRRRRGRTPPPPRSASGFWRGSAACAPARPAASRAPGPARRASPGARTPVPRRA